MSLNLAWIAPLAWGLTALAAMIILKAPRAARPNTPEPTRTANPNTVRDAA